MIEKHLGNWYDTEESEEQDDIMTQLNWVYMYLTQRVWNIEYNIEKIWKPYESMWNSVKTHVLIEKTI